MVYLERRVQELDIDWRQVEVVTWQQGWSCGRDGGHEVGDCDIAGWLGQNMRSMARLTARRQGAALILHEGVRGWQEIRRSQGQLGSVR